MSEIQISAGLIKELRERTGGGVLECKNALVDANGNIETAIDIMRKSGQAKVAKKAGRIAAEGMIYSIIANDNKTAFIVEVNSETDFVARDENFVNFVKKITEAGLSKKINNVDSLMEINISSSEQKTIKEAYAELIAKVGENIQIRRVYLITSQNYIYSYLHGSKIGVLVEISKENIELGKDIAMHIAANKPLVVSEKLWATPILSLSSAVIEV